MSDESGIPTGRLLLLGVGTVVGAVIVVVGSASTGLPLYVPVAFAVLIAAMNLFLVTYGPYRRRHPREPDRTGQILAPDSEFLADSALFECRWVGAGRIRGWLGMLNASSPLVVLTLSGSSLELRVRPAFLAAMFCTRPLRVNAFTGPELFPARGWFGTTWLGIRGSDGDEGYFSSKEVRTILTLLSQRGFTVSWEVRKVPIL